MDEKQETIKQVLQEILRAMGIEAEIETRFLEETVIFNLKTADSAMLIGQHGANLAALQYLARLQAFKKLKEPMQFVVDVEDYKKGREDYLRQPARHTPHPNTKNKKN